MKQTMEIQIKDVKVRNSENPSKKTRIFFFIENESLFENLINRRSRPYNEYRKLLPEVFEKTGLNPNLKANWSQYAGCSCPCSPGFIVQGHYGKEIFVTI